MDYCGPRGIPYGRFLSWDDLSRDSALAWQARESARCGSCGQVKADWVDDDGQELVPAPLRVDDHWCPGCEALERHRAVTKGQEPQPGIRPAFTANQPTASQPDHG